MYMYEQHMYLQLDALCTRILYMQIADFSIPSVHVFTQLCVRLELLHNVFLTPCDVQSICVYLDCLHVTEETLCPVQRPPDVVLAVCALMRGRWKRKASVYCIGLCVCVCVCVCACVCVCVCVFVLDGCHNMHTYAYMLKCACTCVHVTLPTVVDQK